MITDDTDVARRLEPGRCFGCGSGQHLWAACPLNFGCIVCGPIRWWQFRRRRDFRAGRGCMHYGKARPW